MRETPTHGPSVDVAVDENGAAALVVGGLVLVLPLLLFSWLCVAADVVTAVGAAVPANAGIDVFAAVSLTSLFALVARALPREVRATTTAAR